MPYPIYATIEDLMMYLQIDTEEELPMDSKTIKRLLKKSSEFIRYVTLDNIVIGNKSHVDALKYAVCAQVEYIIEIGEEAFVTGRNPSSYSIGDISMNFGNDQGNNNMSNMLSGSARYYLNSEGLLYRGLG